MRRLFIISIIIFCFQSCNTNNTTVFTDSKSSHKNTSKSTTEQEYQDLIKVYTKETEEVLNELLNEDTNNPKAPVVVTNNGSCNMILYIWEDNALIKKIPIEKNGGLGYTMLTKNRKYTFKGQVCNAPLTTTQYVQSSLRFSVGNK